MSGSPAESRGLTDPKLTDFVPLLVAESNWDQWKQLLEIALNGKNFTYWGYCTCEKSRVSRKNKAYRGAVPSFTTRDFVVWLSYL